MSESDEITRQREVIRRLNGKCDYLGITLGEVIAERDRLRAEVEALRAGMQWQPIETAPKTGRKVIAFYLNSNGKTRTVMARWLTDEQAAETDADGVGLEGGWYECIDNWSDYTEVAIHEGEPSHWMPLPPPPAARAKGAVG